MKVPSALFLLEHPVYCQLHDKTLNWPAREKLTELYPQINFTAKT